MILHRFRGGALFGVELDAKHVSGLFLSTIADYAAKLARSDPQLHFCMKAYRMLQEDSQAGDRQVQQRAGGSLWGAGSFRPVKVHILRGRSSIVEAAVPHDL
jgi:hypothetical protein